MTLLKYTVSIGSGWNNIVINLPSGLTIQERKLHRSCLEYRINGGYVFDTNDNVRVKFGTAPDNWAVRAAIKRARNHWLKMHKELFTNNPALKPKWHDFKMALTSTQHSSATTYNVPEDLFDDNLPHLEAGITWSVYTSEDSARSPQISGQNNLTISDKDEFTAHLLGNHIGSNFGTNQEQYTSIGVLQSWIDSRPDLNPINTISASEQSTISNDPLNMLFNDGDADNEILSNFTDAEGHTDGGDSQEGDAFPMYDLVNPPNQIMEVAAARTTSSAPISYFTGFNALLGQVFLRIKSDTIQGEGSGTVDIIFDVEPKGMTI